MTNASPRNPQDSQRVVNETVTGVENMSVFIIDAEDFEFKAAFGNLNFADVSNFSA